MSPTYGVYAEPPQIISFSSTIADLLFSAYNFCISHVLSHKLLEGIHLLIIQSSSQPSSDIEKDFQVPKYIRQKPMPKKKSFHVLLTTTWIVANTAMAQNRPKYAVSYKCTHPGSQFTKKVIPSILSPRPQQNYCIQTCVHDKITGRVFFFTGMVGQIHIYCEGAGCLNL